MKNNSYEFLKNLRQEPITKIRIFDELTTRANNKEREGLMEVSSIFKLDCTGLRHRVIIAIFNVSTCLRFSDNVLKLKIEGIS